MRMKYFKCTCLNKIDNSLNIYEKHLYKSILKLFTHLHPSCTLQISLVSETPRGLAPAANGISSISPQGAMVSSCMPNRDSLINMEQLFSRTYAKLI